MRSLLFLVFVLLTVVVASPAAAGEVIETTSFRLALPTNWTVVPTRPISAKGPAGEVLDIDENLMSGLSSTQEYVEMKRKVVKNAIETMHGLALAFGSNAATPARREILPSGVLLHEMISTGKSKFDLAQFVLVSPMAVLHFTVTVPTGTRSSVDAIRAAIISGSWKR